MNEHVRRPHVNSLHPVIHVRIESPDFGFVTVPDRADSTYFKDVPAGRYAAQVGGDLERHDVLGKNRGAGRQRDLFAGSPRERHLVLALLAADGQLENELEAPGWHCDLRHRFLREALPSNSREVPKVKCCRDGRKLIGGPLHDFGASLERRASV